MRIFYIEFVSKELLGVVQKIDFQIEALKNNNCEVINFGKRKLVSFFFEKEYELKQSRSKILYKILKIFSFIIQVFKIMSYGNYKEGDIIYIRYIRYFLGNYFFRIYLKKLKGKGIKILLEIPTYPYDGEIKKINIKTKLDKKVRMKLVEYIDKIVTYSSDKEIWGIPCINISNGIDLDKIKLIDKNSKNDNKIVFTSVSNCSFWHGIDRFLYSLLEYKKNNLENNIVFNIVGEGEETSKLKKIVENNLLLKDCVIFHGFKSGKELDEIYNETDIGVGSLGRFRSGIVELKSLKNREYCAKGIPMIYSENDLDLDAKKFVFKVENSEKMFNIEDILEWYKSLKLSSEDIRREAKFFSWKFQMKKVIDNI